MHIFGKRIDGYDLVLAIIGVVLVLFGIGAFVGFLTLRSGTGRFVLLGVSIAMFAAGLGLLNSTVFKAVRKRTGLGGKEPPAIDG